MAVTDRQVALVRAYLTGDQAEFDRLQGELGEADVEPYFELVSACFAKAMKAHLPRDDTRAAIIRLVGDLRAASVQRAERIDPRRAERLIAQALGNEPADERDENALWTPLRLIRAMVVDQYLVQNELDDLLVRARKLADLHLARASRGERTRSLAERALRADLARDEAAFQRLEDRFGPLDVAEHAMLVMAALSVQLAQACPKGGTRLEIVELVGEVRARSKWWADSVRPLVAERIVRHLLHEDTLDGLDYLTVWRTARLLLRALIDDQWPDEAELDELLDNARELANRWTGRPQP